MGETRKAFLELAGSPCKMWEVTIYSISMLPSNYLEFTTKPTLKQNRRIHIAEIEEDGE